MRRPARLALALAALLAGAPARAQSRPAGPGWLHVWATAVDTADTGAHPHARGVFLATIDLRPGSPTLGRVVNVLLAADSGARAAHHTEHALAPDGILFANDWRAGRTYRFDLRTSAAPRLLGAFTTAGPLGWPHSFVRLPNGNVLATFQWQASGHPPGGLAELRRDGSTVRWAPAATPDVDSALVQPYSLAVLPALDRVVSTSFSMASDMGTHVQLWRLSDLRLLRTIPVTPDAGAPGAATMDAMAAMPRGSAAGDSLPHMLPGEPRVLADGRTVLFGTFTCRVYALTALDSPAPRLTQVYALPGMWCAVPALVGHWWVQTVPESHMVVALDVRDPLHPREASRLTFPASVKPHWLAADDAGRRLVMDSGHAEDAARVDLLTLDPETGRLAPDPAVPSVDLSRVTVPGLGVVRAVPHGAVFGAGGAVP